MDLRYAIAPSSGAGLRTPPRRADLPVLWLPDRSQEKGVGLAGRIDAGTDDLDTIVAILLCQIT